MKIYRVHRYSRKLSELETENIVETPVGKLTTIWNSNTSNSGTFPTKWLVIESS